MIEPEQCIICLDPLPRASTSSPSSPSAVNAIHDAAATTTEPTGSAAPDSTIAAALAQETSHLDIVASLDGCEHVIHDACIRSWAQKTNTCPICRTSFHFVRVYNGID
ncbi:hypothetical protein E4U53_004741, partial [Claviceps sorghi]